MRRSWLLVAGALLLASCAGDPSVVATVNGEPVHEEDILSLRPAYQDRYVVNSENFRQDLSTVIFQEALLQELETDFGVMVTEADIKSKIDNAGLDEAAVYDQIRGSLTFTEEVIRRQAAFFVIREEGTASLASNEERLSGLWANDRALVTEVCVDHVLVATEAEATDALARITSGEDLADVAAEVSLDTGSPGGQVPCATAGDFVPEFAEAASIAPVGELFGPVETQFGFHVIRVRERTVPESFEALLADPLTYLPQSYVDNLYSAWFNDAVQDAEIEVDSRVGAWSEVALGIVPPGE